MYLRALSLLFLSSIVISSNASILQGTVDVNRLQSILQENIKNKDITALYYTIKGLKLIKAQVPNLCEDIKNINVDLKNIEQVYQLANAAQLTGCTNSLKPDVLAAATQTLDKKDATIPELYHAVYSLKALGKGTTYDKEDGLKNLIQLLKKDDSPVNYAYVLGLCLHMGCAAWGAAHAAGVLAAADESDARALHFEGGLPATALILTTVLGTYKSLNKPSPLTEEQRYKFAEYLLSRRSVSTAKGATLLLESATALADDEPTPIAVTIKGKKYVTSDSDSIEFSITDLLGRTVPGLRPEEVLAQSGTRLVDDVVVLSKQPLTQKPSSPTTYILNLSKIKSQYGLYKIALSAGTKTTSVNIAVLGEIQVKSVEVGVGDVDGTTTPRVTTVQYPNKLTEKLQADHLQKVSIKFSVRDKANKAVLVQQAFVRVGGATDDEEAIFVAEPDNQRAYKVDLNVGALGKHLSRSGAHSLTLFLGDSAAAAPVSWSLGEVSFNFGPEHGEGRKPQPPRGPRTEISHQFRVAEARPARLVSDAAAAACAAPLLLLLALWARLRVNLAAMPRQLSALAFHLALGGSLALYVVLWLHLSMFDTVRYLLPLAALTFLSGHRLLRSLANKNK